VAVRVAVTVTLAVGLGVRSATTPTGVDEAIRIGVTVTGGSSGTPLGSACPGTAGAAAAGDAGDGDDSGTGDVGVAATGAPALAGDSPFSAAEGDTAGAVPSLDGVVPAGPDGPGAALTVGSSGGGGGRAKVGGALVGAIGVWAAGPKAGDVRRAGGVISTAGDGKGVGSTLGMSVGGTWVGSGEGLG
jgi:hypothetical protein